MVPLVQEEVDVIATGERLRKGGDVLNDPISHSRGVQGVYQIGCDRQRLRSVSCVILGRSTLPESI